MVVIIILSFLLVLPSFSQAESFTAANLPSDRTFHSFLQFVPDDDGQLINFFTNRFFTDGRTVTHEIDFSGKFSVFNIDLQERFFLSDTNHFLSEGSTHRFRATLDRPFNDFAFTIHSEGLTDSQIVATPEPATLGLFAFGFMSLLGYRQWSKCRP